MTTEQKNQFENKSCLIAHKGSQTGWHVSLVLANLFNLPCVHVFSQLDGKYPYWKYIICTSFFFFFANITPKINGNYSKYSVSELV